MICRERQQALATWLRPYQRRVIEDTARRIIVLKARQIGISETAAIRAVREASDQRYHDVYLTSLSYREAKELLRKAAKWVRILARRNPAYSLCDITATKIELPNGSRIIALPAKAVRSRSGTTILDEFALQQHDRRLWSDIAPAAETNPNFRLIVISTPFGRSGVFWEIWTDPRNEYGEWSRHKIDVFDAVDEGFPVDPEKLRRQYPPDVWRQEFLCEFGSDEDQYFPHHLLRSSQVPQTPEVVDLRSAGIDLAAEQHASVLVPAMERDDLRYVGAPWSVKPAGESMRLTEQYEDIVEELNATPYDGIAVDGTGVGAQIAQDLVADFRGVQVWKGHHWKKVAPKIQQIRRDLEDSKLFLADDADLLRAYARVRKRERSDRSWRFEAEEDAHGHADEFFASVMALDALEATAGDNDPRVGSAPRKY